MPNADQCRSKSWPWSEMSLNADHSSELIDIGINARILIGIDRYWALIEGVLVFMANCSLNIVCYMQTCRLSSNLILTSHLSPKQLLHTRCLTKHYATQAVSVKYCLETTRGGKLIELIFFRVIIFKWEGERGRKSNNLLYKREGGGGKIGCTFRRGGREGGRISRGEEVGLVPSWFLWVYER